ncbi:hypothetical protein pb186bvf_006650 [Paramecium bursaria]
MFFKLKPILYVNYNQQIFILNRNNLLFCYYIERI